jgi:hypothetical protein
VLQFYLDLMRATFWTSAGTASRLLFLSGLVMAVLGLLNPEVTKAFGANADIPRLWGLAPLAAISLYSFLNENYRRAHALQTRIALSEQIPTFKFSISSDVQMTLAADTDMVRHPARWVRVVALNDSLARAEACALHVEKAYRIPNGLMPDSFFAGPLIVSNTEVWEDNASPGASVRFALGWSWVSEPEPTFHLGTRNAAELDLKHAWGLDVVFVESHSAPIHGRAVIFAGDDGNPQADLELPSASG